MTKFSKIEIKFIIIIWIAVLLLATGHFLLAQDEATSTPATIETTSTPVFIEPPILIEPSPEEIAPIPEEIAPEPAAPESEKSEKFIFSANQEPAFKLKKSSKSGIENLIKGIKNIFGPKFKINQASLTGLNNRQEEIDLSLEEVNNELQLKIKKPQKFQPGKYLIKLEIEKDGEIYSLEQEFLWGVLAINTNKSIYIPGEQSYLQMAVLRDDGHTICDASLKLQITNPTLRQAQGRPEQGRGAKSEIRNLSTEDGTIQYSGKCGPNNVVDVPDYFAYYQVGEPGVYQMKLTNIDNGYQITDSFEVRESVPFEIERQGPTRIYPVATYEMVLKIKANQDFVGEVIEYVPSSFEIFNPPVNTNIKLNDTNKQIIWQVDWKAGQTYELKYTFDAPDISPYLYPLGPLEFYQ